MKERFRHSLAGVATAVAVCALGAPALAQTPPPAIDAARGPISGGTRAIGLGGAFVAIAEDTDGVASNPASPAVRLPYSFQEWDYSVGVHVQVSGWLPHNDLWNRSGTDSNVSKSSAIIGSMAVTINYAQFGFGLSAEAQSNAATRQDQAQGITPTNLTANFGSVHASLAYGFLDGQLLVGAGPLLAGLSFDRQATGSGPLSTAGVGAEVGVIVKPIGKPYRIGAAIKSAISGTVTDPMAGSRTVHLPWQVALGFAYQFGARPLNSPLLTARQLARQTALANGFSSEPSSADVQHAEDELFELYQKLERRYLLLSSELAIIEGGGGHLGLEQYWSASNETGQAQPIISPRLGLEGEAVPNILKLRVGTYYEPALAAQAESRIHGTGGFDVRLFEWDAFGLHRPFDYWQFSVGVDAARSYLNTSFSIGFWH